MLILANLYYHPKNGSGTILLSGHLLMLVITKNDTLTYTITMTLLDIYGVIFSEEFKQKSHLP